MIPVDKDIIPEFFPGILFDTIQLSQYRTLPLPAVGRLATGRPLASGRSRFSIPSQGNRVVELIGKFLFSPVIRKPVVFLLLFL